MADALNDPVLLMFGIGMLFLSIATCVCLAIARFFGPILKFQPRRPVPWNVVGAMLACLFVASVVAGVLERRLSSTTEPTQHETEQVDESPPKQDVLTPAKLLMNELSGAVIVSAVLLAITVYFRATPTDLGLPPNLRELGRDIGIGIVAMFAAFAPVMFIQAALKYLLRMPEQSGHELVKLLMRSESNVGMFAVAAMVAVIVAPILEEVTFRLLLQGWLEKRESKRVLKPNEECRTANEEAQSSDDSMSAGDTLIVEQNGWPFGVVPITISSILFGLAHLGYGPEPVPLFVLAVVLGYVYYRTHRIVPCIVAHSLFNLYSVIGLWRIVFYGSH